MDSVEQKKKIFIIKSLSLPMQNDILLSEADYN